MFVCRGNILEEREQLELQMGGEVMSGVCEGNRNNR